MGWRDVMVGVGTLGFASGASGQTGGWTIEVEGVATPQNPVVTVNLYAWFDHEPGVAEAFAGGSLDLEAAEAGWGLFDCPVSAGMIPRCGNSVGVSGGTIHDLAVGQIWLPGLEPNFSNPILAVQAEWETTDFTPRELLVETVALAGFQVYGGPGMTSNVLPISPGRGVIRVVPAPSAAGPPAAVVLCACARRRRR